MDSSPEIQPIETIDLTPEEATKRRLRSPKKPDRGQLTDGQKDAYQQLLNFMDSGEQMFCFEGFAGVGKSFCINMLTEDLITTYGTKICAATPTHKAKVVLQQMAEFKTPYLEYSTIHSLLGLKPIITDDGKEKFIKDGKKKNSVERYDLIILDESSMIDDALYAHLMTELEENPELKIIFVGDGKQLPPVNHVCSAPMDPQRRDKYGIGHTQLTQIVRQKGTNPIITLSKEIRDQKFQPKSQIVDGQGVVVVPRSEYKKVIKKLFCTGKYEDNPNYCRVVAWTNNTVNEFNRQIRQMMYYEKIKADVKAYKEQGVSKEDMMVPLMHKYPYYRGGQMYLPKYLIEDKVIVDKPIFDPDDLQTIWYQTNEELIILDYALDTRIYLGEVYKIYYAQVKNIWSGETHVIEIVHEDSEAKLEREKERLKKAALSAPKGQQSRLKWVAYYELDKRFARLKYAPALTTYKSQGSTYENIVMVVPDILRNRKNREVFQHLYVGLTRASKRAFLFV